MRLSQKRIREYEKEGFIRPKRQPKTNNRIFTEEDIKRIKRLNYLIHKHGFTIASLKQLLAMAPCWKIFDCHKEECIVKKDAGKSCWEILEKEFGKDNVPCHDCAVFLNAGTKTIKLFTKNENTGQ